MKLLSIVIPSYNVEHFIIDCLSSLDIGLDNEIEVIVINDGSKDNTSKLAHEFAKDHSFVKVIDKENGGHGSGINVGLKHASGLYFKVLDADDHLDKDGLTHLIETIKNHVKEDYLPDLYLADYVSVNPELDKRIVSSVKNAFEKMETITPFSSLKKLKNDEYFMIHLLYVKTSLLKESGIKFLEKTFYEDSQYALQVLKITDTLYYLDKPIYLYTIGNSSQSVSASNLAKNYKHQLRVSDAIINMVSLEEYNEMSDMKKWHIIHEYFEIENLTLTFVNLDKSKEKIKEYKKHIAKFETLNGEIFNLIKRNTPFGFLYHLPPHFRGVVMRQGYSYFGRKKGWYF